jgi:hypothetical protein
VRLQEKVQSRGWGYGGGQVTEQPAIQRRTCREMASRDFEDGRNKEDEMARKDCGQNERMELPHQWQPLPPPPPPAAKLASSRFGVFAVFAGSRRAPDGESDPGTATTIKQDRTSSHVALSSTSSDRLFDQSHTPRQRLHHRSQVTGHRSQVTGHGSHVARLRTPCQKAPVADAGGGGQQQRHSSRA